MSTKTPYNEAYDYVGAYINDGSGNFYRQSGPTDPSTSLPFTTGGGDTHGPVVATTAGCVTVSMEISVPALAPSANSYFSFLQIGGKMAGGAAAGGAGTAFRGEGLLVTEAWFMAGYFSTNDSWATSAASPTGGGATMYVGFLDNNGTGVIGTYGTWTVLANYSGPLLGSASNLVIKGPGAVNVNYNNLPVVLGPAGTASTPLARKIVVNVANTSGVAIGAGKIKVALRGFEI